MQKSKSSTNVGQVFSKKIWKSRSKSQTRPDSLAQPHWMPQVSLVSHSTLMNLKLNSNESSIYVISFISFSFYRRAIAHGNQPVENFYN